MHKVTCITKNHTSKDSSQVDCGLQVCDLLTIILEWIILATKNRWEPEEQAIYTKFCTEKAGGVKCYSWYSPSLPKADISMDFRVLYALSSMDINLRLCELNS